MRGSRAITVGVILLAVILLFFVVLRRDRSTPPPTPQADGSAAKTLPGTGAVAPGSTASSDARGTPAQPGSGAKAAAAPAVARGKGSTATKAPSGAPKTAPPRDRSVAKAAGAATAVGAAVGAKAEPSADAKPADAKPADEVAAAAAPPAAPATAPAPSAAPAEGGDEGATPSGAIAGILIDSQGQPFALTSVLAVAADGEDAAETLTLDDGSFLLPGLRPGRYSVFPGLGTRLPARLGARGVTVKPSTVSRVAFAEPRPGGTVRVHPRGVDGQPTAAQAILIADTAREAGGYASLLDADALYLPELGANGTLLHNVPTGTYRIVLLRSDDEPAVAAPEPLRVTGGREVGVTVRVGATGAIPRG